MRLLLFTCARGIAVDQQTNALSVFNVVERISAPTYPCRLPELHIVAIVRRERVGGPNIPLRVIVAIKNHTLLDEEFDVVFSNAGLARALGRVGDLVIQESSDVVFTLWRGNEKLGEWVIEMVNESLPPVHTSSAHEEQPQRRLLN